MLPPPFTVAVPPTAEIALLPSVPIVRVIPSNPVIAAIVVVAPSVRASLNVSTRLPLASIVWLIRAGLKSTAVGE